MKAFELYVPVVLMSVCAVRGYCVCNSVWLWMKKILEEANFLLIFVLLEVRFHYRR